MITNGQGTVFGDSDNPFALNEILDLAANAYTVRSDLIRHMMDPRRDYDKECGYPEPYNLTIDDYRQMYERNPIAARVVQVLPKESWQSPPEIYEDEDVSKTTPFEKSWKDMLTTLRGEHSWYKNTEQGNPFWEIMLRADVLCGIGRFAIIVLGIDDGKKLEEPVDGFVDMPSDRVGSGTVFINNQDKPKRKLLYMSVYPEYNVEAVEFEKNMYSPRYNKPKFYVVNTAMFRDSEGNNTIQLAHNIVSFKVHWSRVVHVADNLESSDIFGVPRQRSVYNRLHDLVKIYGASGEGFWKGSFPGLSLEAHPQLGGDVSIDESDLRQQLWDYMNGMQRFLALSGMSAKSLSPQVTDPKAQVEVNIDAICIDKGIPKRIFMGSERGELASGQDDSTWNDRLRSRKNDHLTPRVIVPAVDRLIQIGVLAEPGEDGYQCVWPDPEMLKPQEKADIAVKKTEAMAKYVGGQVDALINPIDYLTRVMEYDEEEAAEILKGAVEAAEAELEESKKQEEEQLAKQQQQNLPEIPGQQQPQPELVAAQRINDIINNASLSDEQRKAIFAKLGYIRKGRPKGAGPDPNDPSGPGQQRGPGGKFAPGAKQEPQQVAKAKPVEQQKTKYKKVSDHEVADRVSARKRTPQESDKVYKGVQTSQSMSDEAKKGAKVYSTDEGYKQINSDLRSGKSIHDMDPGVRALNDAANQTLKEPTTTYRGITNDIADKIISSKEYTAQGLVSTSVKPEMASEFGDTVLEIRAKRGVAIGGESTFQGEAEIVQAHGSRYRVMGVTEHEWKVGPLQKSTRRRVIMLEQL